MIDYQSLKSIFIICILCVCQSTGFAENIVDPKQVASIINPDSQYTLVNSVDYHPTRNLFCVTYTHNNKIALYKNDASGKSELVQILCNLPANLHDPQHAVFSPDGEKLVAVNWTNQTLTIYQRENNDFFSIAPVAVIPSLNSLMNYKPHGIAFSPCGNFLAIAYGAASHYGRAIALFVMTNTNECKLHSMLQERDMLPGIPKGITFSPDGTCLLVTFSDINSLVIFELDKENKTICKTPKQVIQGDLTQISRPEDVKISPDGRYCAITNSDQHTVTFYPYNASSNWIVRSMPIFTLENPEAELCFPHGIAFSRDGKFLLVTQFGPVNSKPDGDIAWDALMDADHAKVTIYKTIQR